MNTPLQQAAQAVIDRWNLPAFTNAGDIAALDAALEAEQAANSRIGFLYEELRKATDEGSESMTHDDALKQIAYWRDKCNQVQAVEPATSERAALIHHLRGVYADSQDVMDLHVADMLEADAQEIVLYEGTLESRDRNIEVLRSENVRLAQQVAVPQPAIKEIIVNADYREMWAEQVRINHGLCAHLSAQQVAVPDGWALVPIEPTPEMCAEGLEDEGVTIKDGKRYAHALWSVMISAAKGAKPVAQQVAVPAKSEPLSVSDLFDVYCKDTSAGDWHRAEQNYVAGFRASEQHHGIGAKPETEIPASATKTDWSAA